MTTVVLCAASFALYGITPWTSFIHDTLPHQSSVITGDYFIFNHMVPSAFKWVINVGGSVGAAWTVQAAVMIFCVCALAWGYRQSDNQHLQLALLLILSCLFSPYIGVYDMTVLTVAVLLIANARSHSPRATLVLLLVWLSPIVHILSSQYGLSSGFLALLIVAYYCLSVINEQRRSQPIVRV